MKLFELLPEVILWGSIAYFWIFTTIVVGILFVSEKHDSWFWMVASILIYGFITHTKTDIDVREILTLGNILGYLGIGLVYALIRTYIYGRKSDPTYSKEYHDLKSKAIKWWFLFPVSFLSWIFSDFIFDIVEFIYDKFDSLFQMVFKLGLPKVEEVDDEAINDKNNDR